MRIAPALLALLFLLSFAACGSEPQGDTGSGAASMTIDDSSGKRESTDGGGQPDKTMPAAPEEEKEQEALTRLREYMVEYAPQAVMAAAYLGYREADDTTSLTEWLWNNSPGLAEEMPFIQTIPSEYILGSGYGDLYCVVPRDDRTSLSVSHVTWKSTGNGVWPESDKVLYRKASAQPVLIFVDYEEFYDEPDIEIIASDSGGAGGLVKWYPVWSEGDGGYMIIPTGEDYEPLVLDFTIYGDVTGMDYWGDPDGWEPTDDGWWVPPTEEVLKDTCWVCNGWSLNLLGGECDPDYAGIAELYCQFEDGQEYQLIYSGIWRMVDDCLQLIVSTGVGNSPSDASGIFPVLIDPSGEYLHIQRDRDNNMCPPFFDDGVSSTEMTRSYG